MAEKVYLLNYADDMPSDWTANKFRQIFSFRKGLSITKDNLVDEGVPVISYGQIHSKLNTGTGLNDSLIRFVPETYMKTSADCLARYGDLVFADTSEDYDGIGNCALIDTEAPIFAGYHTIIARPVGTNVNSKYFAYLFQTDLWRAQIRSRVMGIKVFSVTQKDLRETMIFLPPLSEQHAIAAHLDRKCGEIDNIIADLQRQIECLQSYKKSLISEAVTKGLNQDVPMKDSGIEWIGHIPEHWDVSRLKYCCEVKTGPFGTQLSAEEYVDEGVPIINVKNIGYGSIKDEDLDQIPDAVKERLSAHVLQRGDIVFGRKGAVDKHAIINSQHDGWVQGSDCMRIRIKSEIKSEFLNYYFGAVGYGEYVLVNSVGATMASVNAEILNNSVIVFPDLKEQQAIAAYLDRKCAQIDTILDDKRKQVENMKNHRKSVIYEYVTGKKRVKEV